jgi:hypothetical protein
MKILSFIFVITLIVSFSGIPVSARANQKNNAGMSVMLTKPNSSPFTVCIDDSDCQKLGQGDKYACFQFLCYPWKDDSAITPKDKIPLCRKDRDCKDGKQCYRHSDKRNVFKGLCFEQLKECGIEVEDSKCPKGKGCCGSFCCEQKYYKQYSELPCSNHQGCEDLGIGKFCCPRKGEASVCCNVDPNPPASTAAPITDGGKGAATSIPATAFTSSLISTLFFFWLM